MVHGKDRKFLLIGSFLDDFGKVAKHASTFIRMECGQSHTPVVVHLDSNRELPQTTDH